MHFEINQNIGRRPGPRRRGQWDAPDGPGRGSPGRGSRRTGGRPGGPGGHRARRGAVRDGIVLLLGERPMHGYELITELESKSGGRWRPSPGAIYPALEKMEQRGLITATDVDDKRQFSLTDSGRELLVELQTASTDSAAPWDDTPNDRGEMRRQLSELAGQVRQIARFGSDPQRAAAGEVLDRTVRDLYAVLASSPAPPSHTGTDTDTDTDTAAT